MRQEKPAGKPDAGNRHVRFDGQGGEAGRRRMAKLSRLSSVRKKYRLPDALRCFAAQPLMSAHHFGDAREPWRVSWGGGMQFAPAGYLNRNFAAR